MAKENRKLIEKLAGEKVVLAEIIKECVEPIIPMLMRMQGGPELFNDPTDPLLMLQHIRGFNPHDKDLVGNAVRNFYESENYFKNSYQGSITAFEFIENKQTQWNQLLVLGSKANAADPGSTIMMTEKERVIVMMSTIHSGYRILKKRIDLGELPPVNTMDEFITFFNKYEVTANEFRPKQVQQRKIFAATQVTTGGRICNLAGHTPGHIYGGQECNSQCKYRGNGKGKFAEEKRGDIRKITENSMGQQPVFAQNVQNVIAGNGRQIGYDKIVNINKQTRISEDIVKNKNVITDEKDVSTGARTDTLKEIDENLGTEFVWKGNDKVMQKYVNKVAKKLIFNMHVNVNDENESVKEKGAIFFYIC